MQLRRNTGDRPRGINLTSKGSIVPTGQLRWEAELRWEVAIVVSSFASIRGAS